MENSSIISPLSIGEITKLIYALALVTVFFGLASLYLAMKLRRMESLYNKMMQGAIGESIEQMMVARIHDIESLKQKTAGLQTECERMEIASRKHIQQVGVVRFNAFDNTGSDLSFAVAMLDATDSGFVLSGIYGREESRVYAKPVISKESSYMLTKEEKQALLVAINK